MQADSIKIESDEDGFFYLIVEGPRKDYEFRLLCPEQALEALEKTIGAWAAEGRAAFRCNPDESGGLKDLAVSTAYDTAYEINDPKHPDHHSAHADLHDLRQP